MPSSSFCTSIRNLIQLHSTLLHSSDYFGGLQVYKKKIKNIWILSRLTFEHVFYRHVFKHIYMQVYKYSYIHDYMDIYMHVYKNTYIYLQIFTSLITFWKVDVYMHVYVQGYIKVSHPVTWYIRTIGNFVLPL